MPSTSGSLASDYTNELATTCHSQNSCEFVSYQVDDATGGPLVANEEEALASVGGPGHVGVGNVSRLLGPAVAGQAAGLHSLAAEEEELLAGDQVPAKPRLAAVSRRFKDCEKRTWGSSNPEPCGSAGPPRRE